MKTLFTEDGIIGIVNEEITPELSLKVGKAFAYYLKESGYNGGKIVVSEDTRESSSTLRRAFSSGANSFGIDVEYVGKVTIPSFIEIIKQTGSSGGVYISGLSNGYLYNGLSLFNNSGEKLDSNSENVIEGLIDNNEFVNKKRVDINKIGKYIEKDHSKIYEDLISKMLLKENIQNVKIAIDFAHGPSEQIMNIFKRNKMNVIAINNNPDGKNINHNCGVDDVRSLQRAVIDNKCDIGISTNSVGNRVLVIDNKGRKINSDKIAAILSIYSTKEKKTIVLTSLSSAIIEEFLKSQNVEIIKSKSKEKNILSKMEDNDCEIGVGNSNLLILTRVKYCDFIIVLIKLLRVMFDSNKTLFELSNKIPEAFQIRMNIAVPKNNKKLIFMNKIPLFKQKMGPKLHSDERVDIQLSKSNEIINIIAEGSDKKRAFDIAYMASNFIKSELENEVITNER